MSINATESVGSPFATTSTTSPTATTASSGTGSLGDQDTFLQLMVAQMKYQDPMNPTDSSQFLSQTAQFTALEKMTDVADQMALLVQSQTAFGASSMIGRTVRWVDDTGAEQTGTVGGTTFTASGPLLSVGGRAVTLSQVTSIGDDPTLTATAPSGTTTSPSGTVPDGF
jgi:flagellar basal-body rod modification protein FlgD